MAVIPDARAQRRVPRSASCCVLPAAAGSRTWEVVELGDESDSGTLSVSKKLNLVLDGTFSSTIYYPIIDWFFGMEGVDEKGPGENHG